MDAVREVNIGPSALPGFVRIPPNAIGFVIFAHGSGSSRFSSRNRAAAEAFAREGLGSLLFDLLTPDEALDRRNVFDVALLARRVAEAIDASRSTSLPIGLYGASTGAAAALLAAVARPRDVAAVVSRGGRPDLAGAALADVAAPTLLVVGGADTEVLALNRAAARLLRCQWELVVIPAATHLFEEPGALDDVLRHATDWFVRYCKPSAGTRHPTTGT
jgi:alpha-beta hydrolase superfamily lysophospholipase